MRQGDKELTGGMIGIVYVTCRNELDACYVCRNDILVVDVELNNDLDPAMIVDRNCIYGYWVVQVVGQA